MPAFPCVWASVNLSGIPVRQRPSAATGRRVAIKILSSVSGSQTSTVSGFHSTSWTREFLGYHLSVSWASLGYPQHLHVGSSVNRFPKDKKMKTNGEVPKIVSKVLTFISALTLRPLESHQRRKERCSGSYLCISVFPASLLFQQLYGLEFYLLLKES